jgi:hypothetical protein
MDQNCCPDQTQSGARQMATIARPASLFLFESPARLKHRTDMSYWLHPRLRNFLTSDAPNPSEADNMNAM